MSLECTLLESELLLPILYCKTDLGAVHIDDGFSCAQEWSSQNNRCSSPPPVSTTTKSTDTNECPTRVQTSLRIPLRVTQCLICKLQMHGCVQ
jgi:hypothetical protein